MGMVTSLITLPQERSEGTALPDRRSPSMIRACLALAEANQVIESRDSDRSDSITSNAMPLGIRH